MNLFNFSNVNSMDTIEEEYINRWKFFQYVFDTLLSPVRNTWLYWYVLVYILHRRKASDKYFFYLVSMHYAFNALGDFINSTYNFYDLSFGFSAIIPKNDVEALDLKKKLKYIYYLVTVPAVIFWYISKVVADSYYFLKLVRYCNNKFISVTQTFIYLALVFTRIIIPYHFNSEYDQCTYEKKLGFLSSNTNNNRDCTTDHFWEEWWKYQVFTEGLYIVFHLINLLTLYRPRTRLIHDLMRSRSDVIHKGSTCYNHTEYVDDIKHPLVQCFRYDSQFRIFIGSLFAVLSSPFYGLFSYSYFSGDQKTMECLRYFFINLSICVCYVDQILESKFDPKGSKSNSCGQSTFINNKYSFNSKNNTQIQINTSAMNSVNSINNFDFSGRKPQPLTSINSIKKDGYDDFIKSTNIKSPRPGSIVESYNDISFTNSTKKPSPVSNIVMDPQFNDDYDEMKISPPKKQAPIANINTNIYNSPILEEPLEMTAATYSNIDKNRESSKYLLNLTPISKKNNYENNYSPTSPSSYKSDIMKKAKFNSPTLEEPYDSISTNTAAFYNNRFRKYNEGDLKNNFRNYNGNPSSYDQNTNFNNRYY